MIEVGIGAVIPALDDSWWILWDGGGIILLTYLLRPVNFPKSSFQSGFGFWIFQFTKNPSQLYTLGHFRVCDRDLTVSA